MYLVLASQSPRRRELLTQAGYKFQIQVSSVDEVVYEIEPVARVMAIAKKKGLDVYNKSTDNQMVVLSADTIVVINNDILGKPKDKEDARLMIKMLQGNTHYVYTAVFIKSNQEEKWFYEQTEVSVKAMSDEEIEQYISTKEPYDKAGGYAIQGIFSKYIASINGDYYNVMGLPISRVHEELKKIDFTEKLYCLVCKKEVNEDDAFCQSCGAKIKNNKDSQVCSNCHTINLPTNKYCIKCGKELRGNVSSAYNQNECMICHHVNKEGALYCESCGTLLKVKTVSDINYVKENKQDLGLVSLICGIVSLVMVISCIGSFISIVPAVLAIIFGVISVKRGHNGKGVAGLACGVIGAIITIFFILVIIINTIKYY